MKQETKQEEQDISVEGKFFNVKVEMSEDKRFAQFWIYDKNNQILKSFSINSSEAGDVWFSLMDNIIEAKK